MKPHIHQEGSREHVLSWTVKGAKCSEPDCEVNHRPAATAIPGTWTHPMPVDDWDKAYYEGLLRQERAARVAAEARVAILEKSRAEWDRLYNIKKQEIKALRMNISATMKRAEAAEARVEGLTKALEKVAIWSDSLNGSWSVNKIAKDALEAIRDGGKEKA